MFTERQFYIDLAKAMEWPLTEWTIKVLFFWGGNEHADTDENGNNQLYDAGFNPLATTRTDPDLDYKTTDLGYGPGNWNWVPVKLYASHADGVLATVRTLNLSYYANIRQGFKDQLFSQRAVNDFVSWVGSDAYGRRVINFANSLPEVDRETLVKEVVTTLFTEEQKKEVYKYIEHFVSTTYPLYWEALMKGGFTNHPNPLRPWLSEIPQRDKEQVIKDLRDSLNELLEG